MKKILALSILLTVLSSCSLFGGHRGMKGGCGKDKPCMIDSKDGKPAECGDCKKAM